MATTDRPAPATAAVGLGWPVEHVPVADPRGEVGLGWPGAPSVLDAAANDAGDVGETR